MIKQNLCKSSLSHHETRTLLVNCLGIMRSADVPSMILIFLGLRIFFNIFVARVMEITKPNPPRYTTNCILLREKPLLQRSQTTFRSLSYILTDIKTGNIPLQSSLWIERAVPHKIVKTLRLSAGSISINFSLASCTTVFSWRCASSCSVTFSLFGKRGLENRLLKVPQGSFQNNGTIILSSRSPFCWSMAITRAVTQLSQLSFEA